MFPPRKNTAFTLVLVIRDADGDPVSGASALDSEVSIDGGSFSDCTNEATEIGSTGIYTLALTSGEMNGDVITVQTKTSSSGAKTAVNVIYTAAATVDDLSGRIPTSLVSGRIDASVGAMASNVLTASAINADAITAAKVASDVGTEIAAAVKAALLAAVISGVAQGNGGASNKLQLASAAVSSDDEFNGYIVAIVAGAGKGQQRVILDTVNSNDTIEVVGGNWETAVDNTSVYVIFSN